MLAPGPTHELDIRSAALARDLVGCSYPRQWLAGMERHASVAAAAGRGRRRAVGDTCTSIGAPAVQALWLTRCAPPDGRVLLAHATWTKVHSNAADAGWRPFARPSNLTLALDMNLGDRKLRAAGAPSPPWPPVASPAGGLPADVPLGGSSPPRRRLSPLSNDAAAARQRGARSPMSPRSPRSPMT